MSLLVRDATNASISALQIICYPELVIQPSATHGLRRCFSPNAALFYYLHVFIYGHNHRQPRALLM